MYRIISLIITVFLTIQAGYCASIDKEILNSGINKSAISVSVRDLETGRVLYSYNDKKPMNPASTLKAVTFASALNELGTDFEFTTALYKTSDNGLFLKLTADPFLKSGDLKNLMQTAKDKKIIEPKYFKIDDTITDNVEWGEGWQWDDDLNPLMPKFSAYNLDGNLLTISATPTTKGAPAQITTSVFYPITFVNLVKTGDYNEVKLSRNNSIAPDVLKLEGTVDKKTDLKVPVNNPKRYFMMRLEDAIRDAKIEYYKGFDFAKLPEKNIYLIDKKTTPITDAADAILKESNNMAAESVFKIAGGKSANSTGNAKNAVEMLKSYCKKLNVNSDDIKVVDGSGVSKNNLVTADFMTEFLTAQYKNFPEYKEMLAKPDEGTLQNRMLYFGESLRAKTGTLSDVSAITGYLTTSRGRVCVFDIMINDAKSKPSDKKMLEEYILRAVNTGF